MFRHLIALAATVIVAGTAAAEPLHWNYTARFRGVSDTQTILLGQETYWEIADGQEVGTNYYVLLNVGTGWTRTGTATHGEWQEPYLFTHGTWDLSTTRPPNVADHQFAFELTLTAADGNIGSISPHTGSIGAGGVFTTGTGNFSIGFEGTQTVRLGTRDVRVTFGNRESESANRVTFLVEDLGPAQVPEPATLALAAVGLTGLGVLRRRS